jgi:hypothetical protein
MSLRAVWKQKMSSKCDRKDSDSYDIWVSKAHVEKWLGKEIISRDKIISVKANIIASSL